MLISDLAQRTGFSVDTIRFYEKKGLIEPTHIHRRSNSYKEYSKSVIDRLMLIKQAKRLGFTLTEIHQLIRDFESDKLTDEEKKSLLKKKIESIDEKITELKIVRSYLLDKINL